MTTTFYKQWLLGAAAAIALLVPVGSSVRASDAARPVPVRTLTYRADADRAVTKEVRWGRGYYRGPQRYYGGYYGGPRYYYPRYDYGYRYYRPYGGYDYGPRYYGPRYDPYYGGGVRVGRIEVFWR